MNSERLMEAARDGGRLLLAESARLDAALRSERTDAEFISTAMRRAASVSSRAAALVATLADALPNTAERERGAWIDGVQAGMEILQPGDGQH